MKLEIAVLQTLNHGSPAVDRCLLVLVTFGFARANGCSNGTYVGSRIQSSSTEVYFVHGIVYFCSCTQSLQDLVLELVNYGSYIELFSHRT